MPYKKIIFTYKQHHSEFLILYNHENIDLIKLNSTKQFEKYEINYTKSIQLTPSKTDEEYLFHLKEYIMQED